MASGVRVVLRPELQKAGKAQSLSGVTVALSLFGTGPAGLTKGAPKPARLVLHAALLSKAREETKKLTYEEFASIDGTVELKGPPTNVVFKLPAAGAVKYVKDPKTVKGNFRRIHLHFDAATFAGAPPPPPAVAPGKQPPEPHPLSVLFLPEEPSGKKFLVVGAVLEIGGSSVATIEENDKLDVPLTPIRIRVIQVDGVFAPSKEKLDIKYTVGGLVGATVSLEITSKHYPAGPILKRFLSDAELADGTHTIQWDGKCNPASGDLKDKFLNPLFGPYEFALSDGASHRAKGGFKVLYHSLELSQGPFTPDAKEPPKTNKKDWVQYKLNELGYWGGPVGHDFDDYLKKAIIRYKANHKKMHQTLVANYNDTITADLEAALAAGDERRDYLVGDAFKKSTARSKILIEALTYEETAAGTEFALPKAPKEKDRLNRPLIPILATVYLRNKKGKKIFAPEAIGPVRVNWLFSDVREDLSRQVTTKAGQPSHTRAYVEAALKTHGGRTATTGDNCPKQFAGIRDSAALDYKSPFLLGAALEPYNVQDDSGQKVCFSAAHADAVKFPSRRGQAGVYFRPSIVAGDAYQLRADLDFSKLPNHADLDKLHGVTSPGTRVHGRTGSFQIFRRAKVVLRLTWPQRTNDPEWARIQAEFERAYVLLDVSNIDIKPIANFLSLAEYRAVVTAKTTHAAASVSLLPNALVGVALPAQGGLNAAQYKAALKAFTNANYWKPIHKDLRKTLTTNVRKVYPTGFVITEFFTHLPVNIQTAPPGDTTVSKANKDFITWTFSVGLPDSMVFADQKDPDKVYYVVSHEMGHNFWLHHWENAGGIAAEHDTNDHNCSMSYSTASGPPHQALGKYTPHFCGKCNLKLRGWDIDAAGLPPHS